MRSFTVTLTNANQNYNLLDLVRAEDPNFVDRGDMVIQADDDGGAQIYRIGGSTLSDTEYGARMLAGDYSPHMNSLRGVYMRCNLAAKAVAIQIH